MSDRAPSFEDLYEDAPCGHLIISADGRLARVNRTMSRWLGYEPTNLVGKRLLDILTIGGKVYWETHVRPLLRMQGSVEGIPLDFVQREGGVVPAFGSVTMVHNADGADVETRLAIFKAVERRQFEQGLVSARKV
ncbi:MAG: PAS domain-containing protein, partial [Hyphomicrobiales bacterium]